jgi:hypothetical protein
MTYIGKLSLNTFKFLESVNIRLFLMPKAYCSFDLTKAFYKTTRLSKEEKL